MIDKIEETIQNEECKTKTCNNVIKMPVQEMKVLKKYAPQCNANFTGKEKLQHINHIKTCIVCLVLMMKKKNKRLRIRSKNTTQYSMRIIRLKT